MHVTRRPRASPARSLAHSCHMSSEDGRLLQTIELAWRTVARVVNDNGIGKSCRKHLTPDLEWRESYVKTPIGHIMLLSCPERLHPLDSCSYLLQVISLNTDDNADRQTQTDVRQTKGSVARSSTCTRGCSRLPPSLPPSESLVPSDIIALCQI